MEEELLKNWNDQLEYCLSFLEWLTTYEYEPVKIEGKETKWISKSQENIEHSQESLLSIYHYNYKGL